MPHCFQLSELVPASERRLTHPEHLSCLPDGDVIVEIFHKNPLYRCETLYKSIYRPLYFVKKKSIIFILFLKIVLQKFYPGGDQGMVKLTVVLVSVALQSL